ncbi:MAG: hypothetical protein Q9157_004045 [Trypethelium eluteriae]
MLRELRQKILPLIKDVLAKIEDESGHDLFSKTFKVGSCSVRLILSKESWQLMPAYLLGAPELDAANAEMARNSIITFFPRTIEWPMKDSSDPLFDWDCHLVQTGCGNAKADVYGALYFYLRGLLRKFYRHLHSSAKTSFVVSHHNAISLPELMRDLQSSESAPILFDRIDCSNVADEEFLGIKKTLATVGPLLKPKSENPHATILTPFLNAIDNADSSSGNTGKRDAFRQHYRTLMSLNPWALQEFHSGEPSLRNPAFVRIAGDTKLLRDHEKFFNMHMIKQDFSAAAFHAGVKMKQHHTIIEAWPMRLKKEQGETGAKEEFELLRASGHVGCERYVEWVKAE